VAAHRLGSGCAAPPAQECYDVSGEQISRAKNVNLKLYFLKVMTLMTVDFAHISRIFPKFIDKKNLYP
jgi:hypothetical protein